ncbi:hypothetical protein ACLH1Q_06830 [Klebsiella sp. 1SOBk8mer]|uniref:hypothetical protein n=1 Tax=unclassified Klebsiella TaxID=2608929 RepID=UPI0039839FE9
MVTIVSSHDTGFSGSASKISGGPLYKNILTIIESAKISAITQQCSKDVAELGKDEDCLKSSISLAVSRGRFLGSEWCQINANNVWAACDAYSFTEKAWIEAAHKEMDCEIYIKFCIGKSGAVVLIVSFHPPRQRH